MAPNMEAHIALDSNEGTVPLWSDLPVTNVPLLSTISTCAAIDTYSVVRHASSPVEFPYFDDDSHVREKIINGYARFILAFIGLEDITFSLKDKDYTFVVHASKGSTPEERCSIREFKVESHEGCTSQFGLNLKNNPVQGSSFKDSMPGLGPNAFILDVVVRHEPNNIILSISAAAHILPAAALDQISNCVCEFVTAAFEKPNIAAQSTVQRPLLSILNHPPLQRPCKLAHEIQDGAQSDRSYDLHSAFEYWARTRPHHPALDFIHRLPSSSDASSHSVFTYSQLDFMASRLSRHLKAEVAQSDLTDWIGVIPVYMGTTPELYISYLAILKAGYAFCPIDIDAPRQRVLDILEDLKSPFILGRQNSSPVDISDVKSSKPSKPRWLNVVALLNHDQQHTNDTSVIDKSEKTENDHETNLGNETAYVMFTSGSTGKPKGVPISHLAATSSINSHATSIPLPYDSNQSFRWFQFASPTFDPSLMEIFVTLSSGGTLCSAERELTLANLEGTINESKATILMATPSLASILRPERLETVRCLWTMGEKLNRTVIENFAGDSSDSTLGAVTEQDKAHSKMLVNAYGPTEGAINCTYCAPVRLSTRGSIIGKPLPTCSIFILDPSTLIPRPVAAGLCGELAIGGPQVSKGYLNRPDETTKSFVSSAEYGSLYRTGDLARIVWDENGEEVIEFLGRISSDQVKINGRRLELSEVEAAISTVPQVNEVVVVVLQPDGNETGGERLVACIVVTDANALAGDEIVDECRKATEKHLSTYMRPSVYTILDEVPRLTSGKTDRKAILRIIKNHPPNEFIVSSGERPSDHMGQIVPEDWDGSDSIHTRQYQEKLIKCISQACGCDVSSIKPSTSFLSLGIDSLGAMLLLQLLRESVINDLTIADVLGAGTPSRLLSVILRKSAISHSHNSSSNATKVHAEITNRLSDFDLRNRHAVIQKLAIDAEKIGMILPTTSTQSGMLASFIRRSSQTPRCRNAYVYHSIIELDANVDFDQLINAWYAVIAEYDSFRTVFCWIDDDLAPFAQCILSKPNKPKNGKDVYTMDETGLSKRSLIEKLLSQAEEAINIESSPWKISFIRSSAAITVILSMFHSIFDGGSMEILLEDVETEYHSRLRKSRTSIGQIVKHHFHVSQDETIKFWEDQLNGYSTLSFPSLIPDRSSETHRDSFDFLEITASITYDFLRSKSREMNCTSVSVLQAAWSSVLLCYESSGQQDVVIGNVCSGRFDPLSESCIGPTFTTVPLRLRLDKLHSQNERGPANVAVVQYLTKLNIESLPYLQIPLGSVVTSDGKLPYDTLLAFQEFSASNSTSSFYKSITHPAMANDFVVMLEVWPESSDGLVLRATFDKAKMDSAAAETMLRQLSDTVDFILNNPDGYFLEAPTMVTSNIKAQANPLPMALHEPYHDYLLHTQFEKHAQNKPNELALIFKADLEDTEHPGNTDVSYSELDYKASCIAGYLVRTYGSLRNMAVPICIHKSPQMYYAILGILKAGGAWCPIDTLSPSQRQHDLIVRTGAKMVLISGADVGIDCQSFPANIDVLDVAKLATAQSEASFSFKEQITTTPEDMAYLIWTSGTTGVPKGVPIKHSAAVASMLSLQKAIPSNVHGGVVRCLQFSHYTFDVSIQDLFYTWGLGGVVVSSSREVMLGSFAELSNQTQATHAHLTPAFAAGIRRESCKTLEVITMIGEKLPQSVADDWGLNMRAFNTYGPAEATVVATVREFGQDCNSIKSSNIGWPLDTVSAFVTGKNRKLVAKNTIGELALGGPQLSSGYLELEDVNKAKFVWNEEANQILYYTGDFVRMLSDGSMEYLSRNDDLVKLGGIRVELSEISAALNNSHDLVEQIETVVLNRPDRPSNVVISFLVAPRADPGKDTDEIVIYGPAAVEIARAASAKAQKTLPSYMMPSVFLVMRTIPRTPSAKTDMKALRQAYTCCRIDEWEEKTASTKSVVQEPEDGPEQKQIAELVAGLVGLESRAVIESNRLVSIGLDSIRAIRLAARLNESGYKVSVVDVLQCQRFSDLFALTQKIRQARLENIEPVADQFGLKWHDAVASKVKESFHVSRTSPIQESLLSETMNMANRYWSNHLFSVAKDIDTSRLKKAWLDVVQRNDALRTGFLQIAEIRDLVPEETIEFSMLQVTYDLAALDWNEYKCEPDQFHEQLRARVAQITQAHQNSYFMRPPWALSCIDLGVETVVVLTIHHSIHDGPSLNFIFEDVQLSYYSESHQRHQLRNAFPLIFSGEAGADETERFWQEQLQGFASLDSPEWPDLTNTRQKTGIINQRAFITAQLSLDHSIQQIQSSMGKLGLSSLSTVLRSAWACVALSYLGEQAAVFGETLSDRVLDPSLEDVVGPLISVLPFPIHMKGTARNLLTSQQTLTSQSLKYRHLHPRSVQRILNRSHGQTLYPGIFTFHPTIDHTDHEQCALWTKLDDPIGLDVEHVMALNVFYTSANSLTMEASCLENIMDHTHLSLFLEQVHEFLMAMLEYPDENLIDLVEHLPRNLLSVTEPSISPEGAGSAHKGPEYWLELYAGQHPDWTAVEIIEELKTDRLVKDSLTFGQLNVESDRVAAYILCRGIENRMIALCASRSLASYPIIVGIWKSGNTYLPIDEALPDERKSFLLKDGNCPLLFTESDLLSTFSNVSDDCHVDLINDESFERQLNEVRPVKKRTQVSSSETAYLLYTSGSTGKPKGVLVTRHNVSAFVEAWSEFMCRVSPDTNLLGGHGKYLALASRAFDVHIGEILLAWRHGLATVTGPRAMLLDDLHLALTKLEITHASFVPSLLEKANIIPEQCPVLKYLTVGGESISQRVLDTWGVSETVALVNAYGPTEATIGCSSALVKKNTSVKSIGKPLGSTIAHVLVQNKLAYTLRGQPGELCVTGDLVAKGYYNRPDATGFVDDFHGQRMYRTGDIVRLLADGSLQYLGRGDDQTKIRGQRLELGEVSGVIRSVAATTYGRKVDAISIVAKHPNISRSQLVSFTANATQSSKIQAESVSFSGSEILSFGKALQDGCRKVLPAYMVPEAIVPISYIPLAPMSGKADVKQLQALFSSIPLAILAQSTRSNGQPAAIDQPNRALTGGEERLVAAIAKLVMVDKSIINPNTNIFEIGFDSLSVIGLSIELKRLGYLASVASVMSNPTVEKLALLPRSTDEAEILQKVQRAREILEDLHERFFKSRSNTDVKAETIAAVRPCLPLQEGLVARSINAGNESELYVNNITLELKSDVNIEFLRKSWIETANANEILRTTFVPFDESVVQVVLRPEFHSIIWEEQLENQHRHRDHNIIKRIGSVPPIRFKVSTKQDGYRTLNLALHHSLYDGESLNMLLTEVCQRYHGETIIEREPPSSLLDYVLTQDLEKSQQFWTSYLAGHRPTLFNKIHQDNPQVALLIRKTTKVSLTGLETLASSLRTTTASLISAVFALVLADTVECSDVTFGTVLSGRAIPVPRVDTILFPCITTVPTRLNTTSLKNINEIIESTRDNNAKCLEYQHTPIRHIQRWLKSDKPLFNCLFSFVRTGDLPSHDIWTKVESQIPADYPFAVEAEADRKANALHINGGYKPTFGLVYDVEAFLEKMDVILTSIFNHEDIKLSSFNLQGYSENESVHDTTTLWEGPWTSTELRLRDIVTKHTDIAVEDIHKNLSFLSLGIDSVIAIQFARNLRESGYRVSSADILRNPCIGALSAMIEEQELVKNGDEVLTPDESLEEVVYDRFSSRIPLLGHNDSVSKLFRCSPLQSAMITQTIGASGNIYVHPHIVRLSDTVDGAAVKSAFARVIEANDILRTSFHCLPELDFSWIGAIHSNPPLHWQELTIESSTNHIDGSMTNIKGLLDLSLEENFQTPPLRFCVFSSINTKYLVVCMHHAIYDGISLPYIFNDVKQILIHGRDSLHSRPQFSEVVGHLTRNQDKAVEYWSSRLEGYHVAHIPKLANENSSDQAYIAEHHIQTDMPRILDRFLACLLGQRDVVFGHVMAGRSLSSLSSTIVDVEQTIGPLFNTVPRRIVFDSNLTSNKDMTRHIQGENALAQEYQHASLRLVQNAFLRTKWQNNKPSESSLFDALFVFQKTADASSSEKAHQELEQRKIYEPYSPPQGVLRNIDLDHNLNIEIEHRHDGVIIRSSCKGEYMSHAGLQSFLCEFGRAIKDIIEHPTRCATSMPEALQRLPLHLPDISTCDKNLTEVQISDEKPDCEDIVCQVLAEMSRLPIELIEPTTNIYSIGLDSIAAIRTAAACRAQGLTVTVADVLQGQTLRGISQLVTKNLNSRRLEILQRPQPQQHAQYQKAIQQLGLSEENVEAVAPCLSGQVYHLASWLKSKATLFEAAWTYSSNGEQLDSTRLKKAWFRLRQRHPILRTCYIAISDVEVFQVVHKQVKSDDSSYLFIDHSQLSVQEAAKLQAREEAARISFLFDAPVRLRHIHAGNSDAILILINHAAYDAWTMPMFVNELQTLYCNSAIDDPVITDFPNFVHHTLQSLHELDEESYWDSVLANAVSTVIGTPEKSVPDYELNPHQLFVGMQQVFKDLRKAEMVCREQGLGIQIVILLAVARVLARKTHVNNPTFGLYQSGRSGSYPGIERLSGPCVNVTPFTVYGVSSLHSTNTVAESCDSLTTGPIKQLAQRIQTTLAGRIPYEQSFLSQILSRWKSDPDKSQGQDLFNVWVNLLWNESHRTVASASTDSNVFPRKDMLTPLPIGVPTEFIPKEQPTPFHKDKTSIGALNTSFLPDQNIYIDIGPDGENGDTLGFGVRVEGGAMQEDETQEFIGDIVSDLRLIIDVLSG
ncbi:ferrichrome synthetase [Talaromyces pinophilus]|uniref:Nonribosomal peptide synthetase sidC n=1 Tax=Talaromyces pinophilus TaxID=128442 RepID=A0A478EAI6_TALPI|nr:ferrichrome synthetase [Talaromyces pinophilus]